MFFQTCRNYFRPVAPRLPRSVAQWFPKMKAKWQLWSCGNSMEPWRIVDECGTLLKPQAQWRLNDVFFGPLVFTMGRPPYNLNVPVSPAYVAYLAYVTCWCMCSTCCACAKCVMSGTCGYGICGICGIWGICGTCSMRGSDTCHTWHVWKLSKVFSKWINTARRC